MVRARDRYVRFVVGHDDPDSGVRAGLFTIAYDLKRSGTTPVYQAARLTAVLDWFNDHLEQPTRFSRSTSKGAWRRGAKGISWFKPEARDHIAKMYELAEVQEDLGFYTDEITCERPGYIVYQDAFQIVAQLFADAAVR